MTSHNPVLLLDAAWRVDRVIAAERAVELLVARRAVAASSDIAAVFRSPSIAVEVPSVIASCGAVVSARPPACSHRRVRVRDRHVCQFVVDGVACERRGDSVDHLIPRSRGGPTDWANLVAACRLHNGAKADRTLEEMHRRHGWSLRRDPFVPTHAALVVGRVTHPLPGWEPYLLQPRRS